MIHTMLCGNFGRNVATGDDGKRGAKRVSNDSSERHNVYILASGTQVQQ